VEGSSGPCAEALEIRVKVAAIIRIDLIGVICLLSF
jgi:hypothetical protein